MSQWQQYIIMVQNDRNSNILVVENAPFWSKQKNHGRKVSKSFHI